MPKRKGKCKICGKEYEYCRTPNLNGVFRWQDVACCREHGAEYFARIMKSRSAKADVSDDVKSSDT